VESKFVGLDKIGLATNLP